MAKWMAKMDQYYKTVTTKEQLKHDLQKIGFKVSDKENK